MLHVYVQTSYCALVVDVPCVTVSPLQEVNLSLPRHVLHTERRVRGGWKGEKKEEEGRGEGGEWEEEREEREEGRGEDGRGEGGREKGREEGEGRGNEGEMEAPNWST